VKCRFLLADDDGGNRAYCVPSPLTGALKRPGVSCDVSLMIERRVANPCLLGRVAPSLSPPMHGFDSPRSVYLFLRFNHRHPSFLLDVTFSLDEIGRTENPCFCFFQMGFISVYLTTTAAVFPPFFIQSPQEIPRCFRGSGISCGYAGGSHSFLAFFQIHPSPRV